MVNFPFPPRPSFLALGVHDAPPNPCQVLKLMTSSRLKCTFTNYSSKQCQVLNNLTCKSEFHLKEWTAGFIVE